MGPSETQTRHPANTHSLPPPTPGTNPAGKQGVTQLLGSGAEGDSPAQHPPHTHSEQGQPRPAPDSSWAMALTPCHPGKNPHSHPDRASPRAQGVGRGCKEQTPPTPWPLPTHGSQPLKRKEVSQRAPLILTRQLGPPSPKSTTLDKQPSLAQHEKMELMGWVPINQLLIATLSPGPALGQVRAAPPPAPDLHAGDTGTPPWVQGSQVRCGREFQSLLWTPAGQKCCLQVPSPTPGADPGGHPSAPTKHILRERLPPSPCRSSRTLSDTCSPCSFLQGSHLLALEEIS